APFVGRRSPAGSFAAGVPGGAVAPAGGRHYSGLVAGAAVFGISVAFGNPATNQLAARGVTPGRHGLVTGVKQSGVQIGAFLAGLVLPAVAGAAGWRAALGGCALVRAVGLVARVGWGRRQDRTATPVLRSLGLLALGSVVASGLLWAAAALGSGLLWAGAALFGATAVAWNALGMLSIVRDVEVSVA